MSVIEVKNTDHFFTKGFSHKTCEDFAYSGSFEIKGEQVHYAVLSDGCSSSKNTDIGSRILCMSFVNCLYDLLKSLHVNEIDLFDKHCEWHLRDLINSKSIEIVRGLRLNSECLDATLLAVFDYNNISHIIVFGDGIVIMQDFHNLGLDVRNYIYESGAPFYLTYFLDSDRLDCYKNQFGSYSLKEELTNCINEDENKFEYIRSSEYPSMRSPTTSIRYDHRNREIQIILTSDGMLTFQNEEVISFEEITKDLVSYKNFQGQFVSRRMNALLKKYSKQSIDHFDDISCVSFVSTLKEIEDED